MQVKLKYVQPIPVQDSRWFMKQVAWQSFCNLQTVSFEQPDKIINNVLKHLRVLTFDIQL